ncbi:MAG: polyheme membrane-associated cytochrome C, partial [Candidatus Promineifilaceae bacterium]
VAIQANATNNPATDSIVYNASAYPYFFIDANGDGVYDEGDTERYVTWTPELLRAAYNYQYVQKDPGAFAHNGKYVMQFLYDSLSAVGGDVTAMTRPTVEAES